MPGELLQEGVDLVRCRRARRGRVERVGREADRSEWASASMVAGACPARRVVSFACRCPKPRRRPSTSAARAWLEPLVASTGVPLRAVPVRPGPRGHGRVLRPYGFAPEDSANTIVVIGKSDPPVFAACVVLATTRLDVNRTVRDRSIGARRRSRRPTTRGRSPGWRSAGSRSSGCRPICRSGSTHGSMARERIILGGGSRSWKVISTPGILAALPGARQWSRVWRSGAAAGVLERSPCGSARMAACRVGFAAVTDPSAAPESAAPSRAAPESAAGRLPTRPTHGSTRTPIRRRRARPRPTGPVQYKGADLEPARGPGLGCFRIQLVVLVVLIIATPLSVSASAPSWVSAVLLFTTLGLLLVSGQTIIFLLRLVAADRREGRRRPVARPDPDRRRARGRGRDDAASDSKARRGVDHRRWLRHDVARRRRDPRPRPRRGPARLAGRRPRATIAAAEPAACRPADPTTSRGSLPVPVLATFFSVRRGRDPFFKTFMRTQFPKQVKIYEEKFGIRFLGWYNVAHGWDFDNVILLELPDYATLDKLEADEGHPGPRAPGRRMDLRAPPLDVPPGADGSRPRVPRLGREEATPWTAATACSASWRRTPPSSARTS